MTLGSFNKMSKQEAGKMLLTCCGSEKWVKFLLEKFPFENEQTIDCNI